MDLEQEVSRLRAENGELRQLLRLMEQQLSAAQQRIAELEGQVGGPKDPPAFVKAKRHKPAAERQPRQKRAAEHNTSRKRSKPTRIERHALARCPDCAYPLCGESVDYSREVIELPEPQPVEVIEHQVIKRWCPVCQQWHRPVLDLTGQVLGQGRIGVRVAALVAYLRTTLRLPVRQVQQYLATLHGLALSVGEIVELGHDVRQALQEQADQLLAQVRTQPVVHQDETGWREDGQNGYVWATVSEGPEAVRYFEYDSSRSHAVPERLLGVERSGVLVTDFYAAYNLLGGPHQRCWSHLLRDLHDLKKAHPQQEEVVLWAQAVRQLYDQAQAWLAAHPQAPPEERRSQYAELQQRAEQLGLHYARAYAHPCCALAKRLLRHQDELFLFVLAPAVPADNNLAERSLRPVVIMRKISGGTRSQAGSQTRLTLTSLFATWQARHLNPFLACLAALRNPAQSVPTTPAQTPLPQR